MPYNSPRDSNFIPAALFEVDGDPGTVMAGQIDQSTGRILVDVSGSTSSYQTDVFTATNNQTIFTASKTVVYTIYLSINGAIQTPNSDYTVASSVATLSSGIPSGSIVVWLYTLA